MAQQPAPRRVLVVLGHARSAGLNHALVQVIHEELARRGAKTRFQDLLADGFDPVLRLEPDERHATRCTAQQDPLVHRYQEDVLWADAYVIVHPVWWFAPPAVLKGWVDRVLVHEVAIHQPAKGSPTPLLNGRRALLVQTFNAPSMVDRVLFGGIASRFWKRVVFPSTGIRWCGRVALFEVENLAAAVFEKHCARLRRAIGTLVQASAIR